MKLSVLPVVLAALSLVSASPIRIYVLSSDKGVSAPPIAHAVVPQAEPASFIRWGMAAADVKPIPAIPREGAMQAEINRHGGRYRMHHCSGGFRRKMFRLSNWLRKTVGLPPIEHPHRGPHGHHGPHRGHHAPLFHPAVTPTGDMLDVQAQPPHHPRPFHHMHHSTFGGRLQRALLSLGPWEGRLVAFVLGCGIGSLLRMFYVFAVLLYRSTSSSREEEILVDVLYEVEDDAPPSYPEEKVPTNDEA